MIKRMSFPCFLLLSIILLNTTLCKLCHASTKADVLTFVQKILSDPMIPIGFRGSRISEKIAHKPSDEENWESYDILIHGKSDSFSQVSLFQRPQDTWDFYVNLDNLNNYSTGGTVTDWDKMVPKWDAFVARHWPDMHCITNWRNEIWRRSSSGTFTMQYVLEKQKLEVFRVSLYIRLSDGMIGGISTSDVRYLFHNKKIPPSPSQTQIFRAVRKAIEEKQDDLSKAIITNSDVRRSVIPVPDGRKFIVDNGSLSLTNNEGKAYIVTFNYSEELQLAEILNITTQKDLDNFRQKPLTQVSDTTPSWSADGKQLYFVTTRDAKDRGWWNRGTIAFLQALAVNQVGMDNIQFLSPLKTTNGDYGLYDSPIVSPDRRYLAAKLGNDQGHLFILDLQKGILHIPERDPAWLDRTLDGAGASEKQSQYYKKFILQDSDQMQWISDGVQWLKDGDFVYAGWLNGKGNGIYLCKKVLSKPFQNWDILEIQRDKGDDVLPCLSSRDKVLSWAYQDPPPKNQKSDKDDNAPLQKWHFVTADFDATKPGVSNLIQTGLPEEPVSISWDVKSKRWLIVTSKNNLLWIKMADGKLLMSRVPLSLTWNDNKLHPTSAAISPDGNSIALAAELEKPIVYPKTECVIHSLIFNWDGKSTSVKPFYDPSLNGIPRYIFPATNSQWAKVEGNLKKFGLQGVVDPDFATPFAQTNVAP